MAILVRRSNLLLPLGAGEAVVNAWRHGPDAVTFDLENVTELPAARVRDKVRSSIADAAGGAAEVFVRVDKRARARQLEASVFAGLRGIVLTDVESASEIAEAEGIVAALEAQRGLEGGALSFIVLLESPRAVWDMRAIITASARIEQAGLDERHLARRLGMEADPDYDPFVYARGRLAIETTAAKIAAIGMAYPLSVWPRELPAGEIHAFATKARNLGMKGVICAHPSWVGPVNEAFTPTAERLEWNRRVREAFAAGVAAGTAAVPLDGRMIDVPVDEWAKLVIATGEACAARDAEKRAAVSRLRSDN